MEEHWLAGYRDAVHSLSHREIFTPPEQLEGVRTFDFTAARNNPDQSVPISEDQKDERA
jgi:NTE family protein